MRGIVLAVLLTLVGSQKTPQTHHQIRPHFTPDKIHRYTYGATVYNKVQGKDTAVSAFKLTTNVEISPYKPNNYILKIHNPQLGDYVGFHPTAQFAQSAKKTAAFLKCDSKDISFEYRDGHVRSISAAPDTSLFCVNFARGILNMFSVTPSEDVVYEVSEDGIGGECQTRYIADKKNDGCILTKTTDLNNCTTKVEQSVGMSYFNILPNCPLRENMVKGTAVFVITFKYESAGDLITRVDSEQVYEISPLNEPEGAGIMIAKQELILSEVKNGPAQVPHINWQDRGNIYYDFGKDSPPQIMIKPGNLKQQVEEILQGLEPSSIKDNAIKNLELVQLCRRLDVAILHELYRSHANNRHARQALLTGIAYAGTANALKFVKDELESRNSLSIYEQHWIVFTIFHAAIPTDERVLAAAIEILNVIKQQKVAMVPMFGYLAFGSLVKKVCAETQPCPTAAPQALHNLLSDAMTNHKEFEMLLALKSIGNAGQPTSLKPVMKFLSDNYPEYIQLEAVRAVVEICNQDPTKGQAFLSQIFADRSRPLAVRIIACKGLLESNPPLALVMSIVNVLLRENNMQLCSFAYCHMKTMANIGLPHLFGVSSACNVAIKLLSSKLNTLDKLSLRYSKTFQFSRFHNQYRVGMLGKLSWISSPKTVFPTDIISSLELFVGGASFQPIEAALHMQGLSELLWKPGQQFDQYDAHQKTKETEREQQGWSSPEDPLAIASLKVFGQEVAFYKVDGKDVQKPWKDLPTQLRYWFKELLKYLHLLRMDSAQEWTNAMLLEMKYRVPTVVGMPFEASGSAIAIAHASVKASIKTTPSSEKTQSPELTSLQVNADADIALHGRSILLWGINTDEMQLGVEMIGEFHGQVAPRFTATMDLEKMSLKVKGPPVRQPYELMRISHQAHAVTRDSASEKTSPVLPPRPDISIEDESFKPKGRMSNQYQIAQSSEKRYKPNKYGDKAKDECYYNAESGCDWSIATPVCGFICKRTIKKTEDTVSLERTWMHLLCEHHDIQITQRSDRRCSSVDGIQGEIELRSRWISEAHRMRRDVGQFEEDEDEEDQQADEDIVNERKKGYKDVSGHQKKQYGRKPKTQKDEFESRDSSSSSSSSSSSALLGFAAKNRVKQRGKSTSSDSSSGDSNDSSSNSDSTKSNSGSSSSDSTSSDSTSSSSVSKNTRHRVGRHTNKDRSFSSSSDSSDDSSSSSDSRRSRSRSSSSSDSSSSSSSSSSDDSDSNSSSDSDEMPRKKGTPREIYEFRFVAYKGQKRSRQQQVSSGSRSSSSSSSSRSSSSSSRSRQSSNNEEDQTDYQKKKLPEVLVARLIGLRNEKPVEGYEVTLYEGFSAVQIMVRDMAGPGKPTLTCFDAEVTDNKLWLSLRAGRNCRQYAVSATVRAGTFADYPALQLKVEFPKVPTCVESIARDFYELIPGIAFMMGSTQKEQRNPPRQFELITALDDPRSCIVVMRMPKEVYYTTECFLPWPVLVTQPIHISQLLDAPSLVLANLNGVCSVNGDKVKTFNGIEVQNPPISNCYRTLVQFCNDENKLMVMMRPQMNNSRNKQLRIHLPYTEILFKKIGNDYKVYVNDTEISKFPFIDQPGSLLTIEKVNQSLALMAPKAGLLALNYDGIFITIKVSPWLAGKLCGVCGEFHAETGKEFRTPTGYIANNAMSFVQSWVADSTSKYGDCNLKHTAVEIDGIQLRGKSSKCSPIMPVLRCKEGCSATETTTNRVPMHCVPSDSTMTLASRHSKADKAEDLMYDVESHRSCSCDV